VTNERKEKHHHADRYRLRHYPEPHQLVRVLGGECSSAAERVEANAKKDHSRGEGYGDEKKDEFVHQGSSRARLALAALAIVTSDHVTWVRHDRDGWQVLVD
jgi:hypothetical protein